MERPKDFYPLKKRISSRQTTDSKLERSKSLQVLDTLDLDLEIPDNDFDIESFIKVDCTYLKYGNEPQDQPGFTCSQCNPTRNLIICKTCYNECHKDCIKTPDDKLSEIKAFSCFCGQRLKHWNTHKKIESSIKSCTMAEFDRKIGAAKQFYCSSHKMNLCSICAKECHANCPEVVPREVTAIKDCECNDNNHSDYNEFTFVIAKSRNTESYETLKGIKVHEINRLRPIQILNVLFETKDTYLQLITFVQSIINTGAVGTVSKFENPFPRIIGLFSDTFDRKFKTCYYHPEILNLFKYEKLAPFLKNISTSNASQRLLKFRIFFILLFIHLKYDFQLIKSLTSIDFVASSILERLLYKKFIFTPSVYTRDIHQKYKIASNDLSDIYNIKSTVLNQVAAFMNSSIKSGLSLEIYHQEFEIALKFICFALKHMLFNQKELRTLTETLYDFFNKFDSFIESNPESMKSVDDIFNCLVEIFVLIGVNYNDNVVYEYLTKSKVNSFDSKKVVDEFIHVKSEENGMLFKMIVRSCRYIKEHYRNRNNEKGIKFSQKILLLFDQALKLFSIANNFYYVKLSEITEEDITNFYHRYNMIHNNRSYMDQALTKIIFEEGCATARGSIMINSTRSSRSHEDKEKFDSLYILKNAIETHLNDFFTSSNKDFDTVKKIYQELENYSKRISEKLIYTVDPKKEEQEIKGTVEETIEQKRINNYNEKVIKIAERYCPFISQSNFKSKISRFVDELIFSNIDETIFKVLVHFSNRRYYNEIDVNLLNIVFAYLSLFFLTKKGIQYFLLGKNVTRMNKIFNRFRMMDNEKNINVALNKSKESNMNFSKKILEFIYLLCQGMDNYDLNIVCHKVLERFIRNMTNHLENFKKVAKTNLVQFKIHAMLIMNIFYLLQEMINEAEFEEIKYTILDLFDMNEINFFKNEKLIEMFIQENKDDKGRPVSLEEESTRPLLCLKENRNERNMQSNFIEIQSIDDDFNLVSETEEGNIMKVNEALYEAFFSLVISKTYYIYQENKRGLNVLPQNFITLKNLERYKIIFSNKNFSLKLRHSLLKFFRTFYFIDIIDKYDITKMTIQLTTNEYIKYEEGDKKLASKLNTLLGIQKIIEIFTQELIMFPEQVLGNKATEISEYIADLILSVKFIGDFYYKEKNIWSKSCLSLYKLTLHFLEKKETLVKVYKDIKEKGNPESDTIFIPNNEKINDLFNEMSKRTFDVINKNDIYNFLSIAVDEVYKDTEINEEFALSTFLGAFDEASDANFTPFSLVKEKDYEYFYEDSVVDFESLPNCMKKIETIKETFTKFCTDIDNTVFLDIISGISNEADQIDYRREIFDYFCTYLLQCEDDELVTNKTIGILCIVTKMLFYDTEATQENFKFLLGEQYNSFFDRVQEVLKMQYVRIFVGCRNNFIPDIFLSLTNFTKLLLQFLQLLGEGFNKTFHTKILGEENKEEFIEDTFHKGFVENLVYASQFMKTDKLTNYEMPYDKLVVITSNLVDIIVEYMEVLPEKAEIVANGMSHLIKDGFFNYIFDKIDVDSEELTQNSKIICLIKSKLLDLAISFLQNGDKKSDIRQYLKLMSPSVLFEQILSHFQAIKLVKDIHQELDESGEKKFVSTLIDLYVHNQDFNGDMNLQLCFKMFNLIKIYEDLYQIVTLEHTMEKIKQQDPGKMPKLEVYELNSFFAYKLRAFLNELVLKVDIKRIIEDEDENETEVNYETFFIRPPITYYLSQQTKTSFEANVDRSSTSSKLQNLLFYSDYFVFEMVANSRLLGPSSWSKFINKLKFQNVEIFSYVILVIQNLIMMIYHYKGVDADDEEYNEIDEDSLEKYIPANLAIAIIHLIFLLVVSGIWFNYKFPLNLEKNILLNNATNFVFRKGSDGGKKKITQELRDFFDPEVKGSRIIPVIKSLNQEVSMLSQIYSAVFDSILFNREICVLLYTIVFIIIYLPTKCIIFLALPLLFIMNLNATLFNVFMSVKDHFGQLFCILIFMYLFAYNFMWISFHFMSDLYTYDEVYDEGEEEYVKEEFCTSSVPCLLNIIDYFIVSYYPTTSQVSFKKDVGFFITVFFYDIFFFIILALIMVNVFLGVLYDTFGELREILQQKENDIKNVCFICQMTRDGSLAKNIDFNKHVVKTHSMWNYVYFLIFLHISNPNNFNGSQGYVWDKLGEQDNSWIPHDQGAEEEEEDDDE